MFKQNRIENSLFFTMMIFLIIVPSISYGQIGSRDLTQEYCINNWKESPDICSEYIQKDKQAQSKVQAQKQNRDSTQTTNPNSFVMVIGIISAIVLVFVMKKIRKNTVNSYKQNYYRYDEQRERTKQSQNSKQDESREEQRRDGNTSNNSHNSPLREYYEILELDENASPVEIKNKYRELVRFYHPDNFQTKSAEHQARAEKKFKEIDRAYKKLKEIGKTK